MVATTHTWSEISSDSPVPFLTRWKVTGDRMLVAKIRLEVGCVVKGHRHPSEQMSVLLSGRLKWELGEPGSPEYRVVELSPGQVLDIPGNSYHGVLEVIEEAEVIDILSPVGPMGVDQKPSSGP